MATRLEAAERGSAATGIASALEVAELGRGILLTQVLNTSGDLSRLEAVDRDFADRFRGAQAALRKGITTRALDAGVTVTSPTPLDQLTSADLRLSERRLAREEFEATLLRIRAMPSMSNFLVAPSISDLHADLAGRTAVLINVDSRRCDAIVLREGHIEPVRLDRLRLDDVASWLGRLSAAFDGRPQEDSAELVSDMLAWLWDATVQPILRHLRLNSESLDGLPDDEWDARRIWWIPTGLLAGFPLHAAGVPDGPSALDFVVSSYAPTLQTLVRLLVKEPAPETTVLVASVSKPAHGGTGPAPPPLTGVTVEAAAVAALGYPVQVLRDNEATVAAVSARLPDATWAHFACHGVTVPPDPSRSGLLLADGLLDVLGLAGLDLRSAELAYLSACSTAAGSLAHVDEMVTLVSACQLAGYRHVIGTLWPVGDKSAVEVATAFYGNGLPEAAGVRLHRAVNALRRRIPGRPQYWAPFIHSGV